MSTSLKPLLKGESSKTWINESVFDQGDMLPLVVTEMESTPVKGRDNIGWCRVKRVRYLVKSARTARYIPMNEWLCTKIAERSGVPTAPCRILVLPNGDQVFGSRDVSDRIELIGRVRPITYYIDSSRMYDPDAVWRTVIFDLFAANFDRHYENFVGYSHLGQTRVAAIDFSRALLFDGGTFPDPFAGNDLPTRKFATMYRARRRLDQVVVSETLDRINEVSVADLESFIESAPPSWQIPDLTQPLLQWWVSAQRPRRTERILRGCRDGEFV
jgi:hypothetical protein